MDANRVRIQRILCPTDFSEGSQNVLGHAVALTRQFEAQLTILHVVPSVVSATGGPYFPATQEMREQAGSELRRYLALAEPVQAVTELREGEPWREIQAAAEQMPADLVVMGTHGRGGFEEFLLGSVAERVLRRAPCPVLTICREAQPARQEPGLFARILCATDLSEASVPAIEFAVSLAEEQQAELILLHVLEGLQLYEDALGIEPLRRNMEDMARGRLASAVPPEAREWCAVREVVTHGRAHREILRVAAETRAGLIVMGTHGHGALGRMFFGSTSHHVVHAAGCPVLTVRPVRARAGPAGAQASLPGAQNLPLKP